MVWFANSAIGSWLSFASVRAEFRPIDRYSLNFASPATQVGAPSAARWPWPVGPVKHRMGCMSTTPLCPGAKAESVDPETERTIRDRLASIDEDVKTAVDARKALAEIRKSLQHPKPR